MLGATQQPRQSIGLREGQRRGELRADFDPDDTGRTVMNFFLIRFASRDEPGTASAAVVAELVVSGLSG